MNDKLNLNKEQSYVRFWVLFALLSAIIFTRYGLQINIPRELALLPVAAIALLGNQTEITAVCMCLIPFHESLDFYIALIIVVFIYVLKFHKRIKINMGFFLMLIIVIWELLHSLTSDFSPITFVTALSPIIALTVIICSDLSGIDYAFTVRAVSVAAVVTCFTMLIQIAWISGFNVITFMLNLRRLGALSEASADRLQITGGMVQTNSLGVICVLITAALLQLRNIGKKKKSDTLMMLTLLIFGTLTASRTFIICLLLMILLVFMGQKDGKTKLKYFGIAIIAAIFILSVLSIFFPDQLEFYISRFFEKDITTGRDDLMVSYNRFITKNPSVMFFGVGLQDLGNKLVNIYRVASNVPHNSIQEIMAAWGIEGLLFIGGLILTLIVTAKKQNRNIKLLNYIPLIIILFKSVAGQLLTSNYTVLTLGFAYINMIQDLNKTEAQ
ncbi:MAG: hypothetical protein E7564_06005 [Ruminococcaceae bacterium]|nr:hypothetical protein [Oscillospiraceae bacterium]